MTFWHLLTRLGEAQILVPLMLIVAAGASRDAQARPGLLAWLLAIGMATLLVTATKVAFIGYGVGSAAWDFTGLSGHAMFACACLPMLAALVAGPDDRRAATAAALGLLLALGVAVSRVEVRAHSWSEVVLGSAVGLAVTAVAWQARTRRPSRAAPLPLVRQASAPSGLMPWLPALVLGWLVLLPALAPPSRSHDWVTRLSLAVSGNTHAFTRAQMLQKQRRQGS